MLPGHLVEVASRVRAGAVRPRQLGEEDGAALARGGEVRPEHLPEELRNGPLRRNTSSELRPLADVEREHVRRVPELCGGHQVEVARVLQVSRSTLWRKLRAGEV